MYPSLDSLPAIDPAALAAALALAEERAEERDRDASWPEAEIAALADAGLLKAPLPAAFGGAGLGTTPEGAMPLLEALRRIGRVSLPLGRLVEGHVNALRLICRFAEEEQLMAAAAEARAGRLFGVWNTEAPPGLRLEPAVGGWRLAGGKIFASGAGHLDCPLVTARLPGEERPQLVLLDATQIKARVELDSWRHAMHGMRASLTGSIDFSDSRIGEECLIGHVGDYHLEPDFLAGAWRFAALQAGALEALLEAFALHLKETGRDSSSLQRARIGEVAMAAGTARLWLERAVPLAEDPSVASDRAVAAVDLARLTVEAAALEVIRHVRRGIGMAAFLPTGPVERIVRDLELYLRQPAPDAALERAAGFVLDAQRPAAALWP